MNTEVMFSSTTDRWSTPEDLFRILDSEFHFTLDVCADSSNAKCERYFTEEQNGLAQDWTQDTCWMNPPYGREIGKWMKKAVESMRGGRVLYALSPAGPIPHGGMKLSCRVRPVSGSYEAA